MKDFKKLFGAKVRYYRNLAKLTQEQLAEKTGISPNTIGYIERGKNTIRFTKIPLLAEALGIEVYKLFVFVDIENDPEAINKLMETATEKEKNVIMSVVQSILSLK